ncbi:MAG TPA: HAMP domain-containing sensor histidine kinase, partial [Candidatus Methylacidiphilales bacterium]
MKGEGRRANPAETERREERAAFVGVYTGINLQRGSWLVPCMLLWLGIYAYAPSSLNPPMRPEHAGLLALVYVAVWIAILCARRKRASPRLKQGAAWAFYLFNALSTFPIYWETHSTLPYCNRIFTYAVILVLPPRISIPLFAGGHVLFVAMTFWVFPDRAYAWREVISGTFLVVAVWMLCLLTYRARLQEFRKERTILRQVKELELAHAELDEMTALTAHDLRSPLYGLRDVLHVGATLPDLTREQAARIFSQTTRFCDDLLALTGRLLDAHTAEYGDEVPSSPQLGDVRQPFLDAVDRAQVLTGTRRIEIVLSLPPEIGPQVDQSTLNQALDNLLSNAVRHSPDGGRIEVELTTSPQGWRGEVRDEGPGVPEADREYLFRKFHRGRGHRVAGKSGTGLGLFIVAK